MTSEEKSKFRQRKEWKQFRETMRKLNKVDFLTGSKLTKTYNLHHLDFHEENYTNLVKENFLTLNNQSHDCWHQIYGDPRHRKDWRKIMKLLEESFVLADKLNGDLCENQ